MGTALEPGTEERTRRNAWSTWFLMAFATVGAVAFFGLRSDDSEQLTALQEVATVNVRVIGVDSSQPGTRVSLTSFAAARDAIDPPEGTPPTDIQIAWPGASGLDANPMLGASVTLDPTAGAIVFQGDMSLDGATFDAMLIADWEVDETTGLAVGTPTLSLGVKGNLDMAQLDSSWAIDGSAFAIDGYVAIATGPQDLTEIAQAATFYDDREELDARLDIEGSMSLADLFPGNDIGGAVDVEVAAFIEVPIDALLSTDDIEPRDSRDVSFVGSVSASDLNLPALSGLTAGSFEVQIDLAGDEGEETFAVRADGEVTIDNAALSSAPVTFAVGFISEDGAVSLTGGLKEGTTWVEPFGADIVIADLQLSLDAPGGGETPTLGFSTSANVGGVSVDVAVEANDDIVVEVSVGAVKLSQLVDVAAALGLGSDLDLDDELGGFQIEPTALRLSTRGGFVDAALTTGFSFREAEALLLFAGSTDPAQPLLAAIYTQGLRVRDLAPGVASVIGDIALPSGGFVVSTAEASKADFEPNGIEDNFLAGLHCDIADDNDVPDCEYDIASGLSLVATIELDDNLRDALSEIAPLGPEPVRITGTLPIFEPGDADLTVTLPSLVADDDSPLWFVEARLSLSMSQSGTESEIKLVGELDTRLPDETEENGPGTDDDGYDEVTFAVDAAFEFGESGGSLTIGASIGTWDTPFGIEWVDLNGFRVELKVTVGAESSVQLGLAASATLKDPACILAGGTNCGDSTTLEASFAIAVSPGPPARVTFGFRVYADVVSLRDVAAIATQMGATSIDPESLPDASLREVELSFSLIDAPDLCLSRGLIIGADVYLDSPMPSAPSAEEPARELCTDTSTTPQEGIDRCANDDACFAHLRLDVSEDGIFASASIGEFDLGPVTVEDAEVQLALSPTEQRLYVAGGVSIEHFGSARGSLELSDQGISFSLSTVGPTGRRFSIRGAAGIDPDVPGFNVELQVFVEPVGLAAAIEGAQDVIDAVSGFFGGDGLPARISLRCLELDVDLTFGGDDPLSGEIAARVHFSKTHAASGYEEGKYWELSWDFDKTILMNARGLISSFTDETVQDDLGCAFQPVETGITNSEEVEGVIVVNEGDPVFMTAAWTSTDFATYSLELDLGGGVPLITRGPQQYSDGQEINFLSGLQTVESQTGNVERRTVVARMRAGGLDGPIISTLSKDMIVGGSQHSNHSLEVVGTPTEGESFDVTAAWTEMRPGRMFQTNSIWSYQIRRSSAFETFPTTFYFFGTPADGYPANALRAETRSIPVPDPCTDCVIRLYHELSGFDTDIAGFSDREFLDIPVEFSEPAIDDLIIRRANGGFSDNDNVVAASSAIALMTVEDLWDGQFTVSVNGKDIATTNAAISGTATVITLDLSSFHERSAGASELTFRVRRSGEFGRSSDSVVTRTIRWQPDNVSPFSPRQIFLGSATGSVTATGSTRFPDEAQDFPYDPLGAADCGAVWYRYVPTTDSFLRLSATGQVTATGGVQEIGIAVYLEDDEIALAEIVPDGNPATDDRDDLELSVLAGETYLIALGDVGSTFCSDVPEENDEFRQSSGPVSVVLTKRLLPPPEDTTLGSFAQASFSAQFALTSDEVSLDSATSPTFDSVALSAPGFSECFGDSLDQTVWYGLPYAAVGHELPIDVQALTFGDGDLQLAVFEVDDLGSLANPTLVGCNEDAALNDRLDLGGDPLVSFTPRAGANYVVMFDTNGTGDASAIPLITGAGAIPSGAVSLETGGTAVTSSTTLASPIIDGLFLDIDSTPCVFGDLVFRTSYLWVADTSDPVDITVAGDIDVALFSSVIGGGYPLEPSSCRDSVGAVPETLRLNPTVGDSYLIVVAADSSEANGTYEIDVTVRGDSVDTAATVNQFPIRSGATNATATPDGTISSCAGADVTSVVYEIETNGLEVDIDTIGSDVDTTLVVLDEAGVEVACNDDAEPAGGSNGLASFGPSTGTGESKVTLETDASQTYLVRVDGKAGAEGDIALNVSPRGDDVANAVVLEGTAAAGNPVTGTLSNRSTSVEPGERFGDCFATADSIFRTVWFQWTPPTTTSAVYDVSVTGFDAQLTVFDAANDAPGNIIGCGEDEGPSFTPVTTFDGPAGEPIFFQIDGWRNDTGDATITIEFAELLDRDDDGVVDDNDNCNDDANPGQADLDDDGIGDACDPDADGDNADDATDNCLRLANADQTNSDDDADGDACDTDDDNDGVDDAVDNCRVDANANQGDNDNDSQGDVCDADDDNDGVNDAADNCPVDANSNQADNDGDGQGNVCDATPDPAPGPDPDPGPDPEPGPTDDVTAFTPLTPARLVDTRATGETADGDFQGDGSIASGDTYEVTIAGRGGIAGDATAAVINLTTVGPPARGFLTIHPCGDQPLAASINYGPGQITNNEIIAKLSPRGTICIYADTATGLVVDAVAYTSSTSGYLPLTPARVVDARATGETIDGLFQGDGLIAAADTYRVTIAGRGGVSDNAVAAALNLTTVSPQSRGFLTIYPCDEQPLAAGVNYEAGQVTNNEIITKLSDDGEVCIFASAGTLLVIDVVGQIIDPDAYSALTPARVVDTRASGETIDGIAQAIGTIDGGDTLEVQIGGRGGVANDAELAVLNLTTVSPTQRGFLTIHPCGEQPLAAGINYGPGEVANNEIIAKLSDVGTICIYAEATTHLVIDAVGYA